MSEYYVTSSTLHYTWKFYLFIYIYIYIQVRRPYRGAKRPLRVFRHAEFISDTFWGFSTRWVHFWHSFHLIRCGWVSKLAIKCLKCQNLHQFSALFCRFSVWHTSAPNWGKRVSKMNAACSKNPQNIHLPWILVGRILKSRAWHQAWRGAWRTAAGRRPPAGSRQLST